MSRAITDVMWAEALAMLDRAEHVHRAFFHPAPSGWEPPIDLLETEDELIILAALPGVKPSEVDLAIRPSEIAIVGTRRCPRFARLRRVHRMEVPHGHFERRIRLPPGQYELTRRDLEDGCLTIVLRKLG